jgi:hypothetical protein
MAPRKKIPRATATMAAGTMKSFRKRDQPVSGAYRGGGLTGPGPCRVFLDLAMFDSRRINM